MTEPITPATASGSPLVFRSSYRRAQQAPAAQDALDYALSCSQRWDRARALLAVVRRPDLTAKVVAKMAANHQINCDQQWVSALVSANPRLAASKSARPCWTGTCSSRCCPTPTGSTR